MDKKYQLVYKKSATETISVNLISKNRFNKSLCDGNFISFKIPEIDETVQIELYATIAYSNYGTAVAKLEKECEENITVQLTYSGGTDYIVILAGNKSANSSKNINPSQVTCIEIYRGETRITSYPKTIGNTSISVNENFGLINYSSSSSSGTITYPKNVSVFHIKINTMVYPLIKTKPKTKNNLALRVNGETFYLGAKLNEKTDISNITIPSLAKDSFTDEQKNKISQESSKSSIDELIIKESDGVKTKVTVPITVTKWDGSGTVDMTLENDYNEDNTTDYITLFYSKDGDLMGGFMTTYDNDSNTIVEYDKVGLNSQFDIYFTTGSNGSEISVYTDETGEKIAEVRTFGENGRTNTETFHQQSDGTFLSENGRRVNIDFNNGTVTPVSGGTSGSGGTTYSPPGDWDFDGTPDYDTSGWDGTIDLPIIIVPDIGSGDNTGGDNTGSGENTGDGGEDSGGDSSGSESGSDSGSDSGSEGGE